MKTIAKKLGLKDKGIYPNHRCGCGVNTRLGEDADGQTWSWCPKCKVKLNIIVSPTIPFRLA